MGSGKKTRLDQTVSAIQARWGSRALRKPAPQASNAIPRIPTCFPSLDALTGGFPRGGITELLGAPTAGATTLALKTVAQAQAGGDIALYLDLGRTFDPDYAARCGVRLDHLLLARPHHGLEALEAARAVVAGGGAGVLVFDSVADLLTEPAGPLASGLRQLAAALARSSCAALFLTPLYFGDVNSPPYPPGFALPHYATLRLHLEKESWLTSRHDVRGYKAQVTVLKSRQGSEGRRASLAITFDGVVRGNGT